MVKIKNLKDSDSGNSMVIGVVLMVSIVVVISSVVYLSAHGLANSNIDEIPRLEFHKDEKNDRIYLFQSDTLVEWREISIRTTSPITILINGEVVESTTNYIPAGGIVDINNDNYIHQDTVFKNINASDFIDIEGTNGFSLEHVSISLVHKDTNVLIGSFEFKDITGQDTF